MNKRIFKYEITSGGYVRLPVGAEILSVGAQRGAPFLWAIVDPDEKDIRRRQLFVCVTGGPPPPEPANFLGTILLEGGFVVLHVFAPKGL